MSRHFDWARAKQLDRDRPRPKGPSTEVPKRVWKPATARQLAYIRCLDPTIPSERLAALNRWEASIVISRLLMAAKAADRESAAGEAGRPQRGSGEAL